MPLTISKLLTLSCSRSSYYKSLMKLWIFLLLPSQILVIWTLFTTVLSTFYIWFYNVLKNCFNSIQRSRLDFIYSGLFWVKNLSNTSKKLNFLLVLRSSQTVIFYGIPFESLIAIKSTLNDYFFQWEDIPFPGLPPFFLGSFSSDFPKVIFKILPFSIF